MSKIQKIIDVFLFNKTLLPGKQSKINLRLFRTLEHHKNMIFEQKKSFQLNVEMRAAEKKGEITSET